MNLLLVADGHYFQTPDGTVYVDSIFDYGFYKRYLAVFDQVFAVVRVKKVEEAPAGKKKASGEGVTFLTLPDYHGPYQYAANYLAVRRKVREICNDSRFGCAIFRLPSSTANDFCRYYAKTGKPFAVEVVIDPWENFSPRSNEINGIMRRIVRRSWTNTVAKMCRKANGASYVTERYLQEKYPPRAWKDEKAFEGSYSSVEIADDSYGSEKHWSGEQKKYWISHASNYFASYGKGHLTVMRAVKLVRDKGFDLNVLFVGDGPKKQEFAEFAASLGISENVVFAGRLPSGNEVRKAISDTDIFILPTLAEGLPRALLEAMSMGLPCLSSPICGIPEVLSDKYLYDFADYEGFASAIIELITHPKLMEKASAENLGRSKDFAASKLTARRNAFYSALRSLCETTKEAV